MKSTALIIVVAIILLLVSGYNIMKNLIRNVINARLDSSEAVIINELDGRMYKDFHSDTTPYDIEVSEGSFQYGANGDFVRVENIGDKIRMSLEYKDGQKWVGEVKGKVQIDKVDKIQIKADSKEAPITVDMDKSDSQVYAITYEYYEDLQKDRITLNRSFTRYLAVVNE